MSQRIRDEFDRYLQATGLAHASPEAVRVLRRAFFAGAGITLVMLREISAEAAGGTTTTADAAAQLGAWRAECLEFGERVVEGAD